ncbi:hypothetical protein, partial [Streptomyces sp. rh34]|uniref:hypothetical protein n=1 Tax=Streptomyces sp. rh34 TaxID=2034272 RepID=UPI001C54EE3E
MSRDDRDPRRGSGHAACDDTYPERVGQRGPHPLVGAWRQHRCQPQGPGPRHPPPTLSLIHI